MDWNPTVAELLELAEHLLRGLRIANADGAALRSRELSLAITKVEEAIHWLRAAEK